MTQGTGKRGPRGSGTVRERKQGYWEVRVPVRAADGRPTQVSRYIAGTRKDAEKARRTLLEEVDKGHHRQRKKSVGDLFERWFDLVSPDRSPATVRRYRSNLDNHILPAIGHIPLDRLQPTDLDELYIALRKQKGLKPSSVRAVHQVIHTAFRYGVKSKQLVNNPADRSTPPKARSRPIEPPEWSDVAKLVGVAMERGHETMAVLIFLAAATGMRRGELAGLRWGSLENAGQLNVWQAVIDAGAGRTLVKETKNHRYRTIAVAPEVLPFLAAHRERMERRAAAVEVTLPPRAFVFSDSVTCAMPLSPGAITDRFGRIREWAGLPTVRLHDLRHLAASFLFEQGFDAVEIGGRLGHSGGALALQLYGHFSKARDLDAAAAFGKVLPTMPPGLALPSNGHMPDTVERH